MASKKTARIPEVLLIDGEASVLVDGRVTALIDEALGPSARDFNFQSMTAGEVSEDLIRNAAETLPVFAQRRVVYVKDADRLNLEALSDYLQKPNPSTCLIVRALRFDGRSGPYKRAKKAGYTERYDNPKERDMPAQVESRARQMGVNITAEAARAVVSAVGADLGAAWQALELLSLYMTDPKQPIRASDVAEVVSLTREASIFDMVDAIGRRDRQKVLDGLFGLIRRNGQHPLQILSMIARQYRLLVSCRAALDSRWPESRVASELKLPPFVLKKLMQQARSYDLETLTQNLNRVVEADQAMKGGALNPERALERLLFLLFAESGRAS